jgi:hypothetical protein
MINSSIFPRAPRLYTQRRGACPCFHVPESIGKKTIDLIVIRSLKTGELAMAKPCSSCLPQIKEFGIRYVYYSNNKGYISKELACNMETDHISAGNRIV